MSDTVLINAFEVPVDQEAEFLELWNAADRLMHARSGYRWTRLHRALTPDARFRFVNVAALESVDAWRAALDEPEFRAISARMAPFHPTPALYTLAVEHRADQTPD